MPHAVGTLGARIGVACLLLVYTWAPLTAGDAGDLEYHVKAAFLYNFARFVEWPQSPDGGSSAQIPPAHNAGDPFHLCILGRDPFGSFLDSSLAGKIVAGRAVTVVRLLDSKLLDGCQALFISSSERKNVRTILGLLAEAPVLTISEIPGFAQQGGMVNFYLEDQKVHFEINPKSASRTGLRVSSQLLRLSRVVDTSTGSGK